MGRVIGCLFFTSVWGKSVGAERQDLSRGYQMELLVSGASQNPQFKIIGLIDENGAANLKEEFDRLNLEQMQELVLDFGGVTFIGSAGLGKLLLFYKRTAERNGQIKITNLSSDIAELLKSLNMDTLFSLRGF